jgi:hypothetical protein
MPGPSPPSTSRPRHACWRRSARASGSPLVGACWQVSSLLGVHRRLPAGSGSPRQASSKQGPLRVPRRYEQRITSHAIDGIPPDNVRSARLFRSTPPTCAAVSSAGSSPVPGEAMKNRVLESLGVPPAHFGLAKRLAASAAAAGVGQKEVRSRITAVISAPGSCVGEPYFGPLVTALLA